MATTAPTADTRAVGTSRLPGRFDDLVAMTPPRAIADDGDHDNAVELIDRLMQIKRPTKGHRDYAETWIALVEAYEREHHAINTGDISGLETLKGLMAENGMSAADLGRLLGVHRSHASKILNGDRGLTASHMRKLGARFKVDPGLFL